MLNMLRDLKRRICFNLVSVLQNNKLGSALNYGKKKFGSEGTQLKANRLLFGVLLIILTPTLSLQIRMFISMYMVQLVDNYQLKASGRQLKANRVIGVLLIILTLTLSLQIRTFISMYMAQFSINSRENFSGSWCTRFLCLFSSTK